MENMGSSSKAKSLGGKEKKLFGPLNPLPIAELGMPMKKKKKKKKMANAMPMQDAAMIPEFKKGGMVQKTGIAKVHKGETIVPAERMKKLTSMEKYHKKYMKQQGLM